MKAMRILAAIISLAVFLSLSACSPSQPTIGINSYSGDASITTSQTESESSDTSSDTTTSESPVSSQDTTGSQEPDSGNSSSKQGGDQDVTSSDVTSSTESQPETEEDETVGGYTPISEDGRFCYTSGVLSKSLKLLYCNIRNAVKTQQPTLSISASSRYTVEDLQLVMRCVDMDFPEFYWLSGNYTYVRTNGAITRIDFEYLPFNDAYTAAFNKVVDDFIASLPAGLSEYDRELLAHDFICSTADYCTTLTGGSNDQYLYSAYGALVNKNCVCEGYSRAMQLLMLRVGIQCGLVCGTADGAGHMWNIIRIGGDWYYLDSTWDDPVWSDGYNHMYFNVTTAELLEEGRVIDPDYTPGAEAYNIKTFFCEETEYNYYIQNNTLLDGSDDTATILSALKKADEDGTKRCEFYAIEGSEFFKIAVDDTKQDLMNQILSGYGITHFTAMVSDSPNKIYYSWA